MLNKDEDDELTNIDNAPFTFSCAGLSDIYEVIGKLSNAVQKPNIPPWEVSTIIETYSNALQKMANNIEPSDLKTDTLSETLFPTLSSMVKEVSEKGKYNTCPILFKKHSAHSTRCRAHAEESVCVGYDDALKVAGKTLHSFASDFVSNVKTRFDTEEDVKSILLTAGSLFDVTKILNYETSNNIKSDLSKYVNLAKESGNFTSEISIDDLVSEYKVFAARVKDISSQYRYVPIDKPNRKPHVQIDYPERYLQLDLYKKILETPNLYKDIGNVLHLSLTALCRTHCEAVVEGMGSVMTSDMKSRGRLDVKTIERETLIRWQGPHPASKSSNELIATSLDHHFKGRSNWHFCSKDERAKYFTSSEVLMRIKKTAEENEKISFVSETE